MRVTRFDIPAKVGSEPNKEFLFNDRICNPVARSRLVGITPVRALLASRSTSATYIANKTEQNIASERISRKSTMIVMHDVILLTET
jgi:hypothetical protein